MRRVFKVSYGRLTTTFTQQPSPSSLWSWVTTDDRTHQRIDGAEADSTAVLYMLFSHLFAEPYSNVLHVEELHDREELDA